LLEIVLQTNVRIVEIPSKTAIRVVVYPRNRKFCELEAEMLGLDPKLKRHRITGFGELELSQRRYAVSLEAAERICHGESGDFVDYLRYLGIDCTSIGRSFSISIDLVTVSTPRNYITFLDLLEELRDPIRSVLSVRIHGDNEIVPKVDNLTKAAKQSRSIPTIPRLYDNSSTRSFQPFENLWRTIDGAIVYEQYVSIIQLPEARK
jgi:hypothetical protein